MKLPVPSDTRSVLMPQANNMIGVLKTSNLGLLFNKFVFAWSDNWTTEEKINREKVNLKAAFIEKVKENGTYSTANKELISSVQSRQKAILQNLQSSGWHVEPFNAKTDSRLIIGLGGISVIETGMTLHPLYGFPYLPGSGLKGLARAYAEIALETKPSGEDLREIFGSEDKDSRYAINNRQGKVFFMDGIPTAFPQLDLDIMNPHYSYYYQGKKDTKGNPIPPADYLNPVPVTFLTVASEQKFSLAVFSRNRDLLEKATQWLICGLTELGAGGKTNVGYGYFKIERQEVQTQILNVYERKEETSITARLKLVKNEQTFGDFVKSIKSDEIESLRSSTFKGMESVLNIGLTTVLESSEVSTEIKRLVAEKMLEVCKKPDKKYKEKLEKYNRLFSLARKDT